MSLRFEILKNGKRVYITGRKGLGALFAGVSYAEQRDRLTELKTNIGGVDSARSKGIKWPSPDLQIGDELTIRILPAGEFDEPEIDWPFPFKSIQDPDFDYINFHPGFCFTWSYFRSEPFSIARAHVVADENGPTDIQRQLFRDLPKQHNRLWPEIRECLVRSHPEFQSTDELMKRIMDHVGIKLYGDQCTIDMIYFFIGSPDYRTATVTLREWKIIDTIVQQ